MARKGHKKISDEILPPKQKKQLASKPREGRSASARTTLEADVVVFGAGISGLTVAHELAERNFRVVVIDPSIVPLSERRRGHDNANPGVGGMAKSQWCYFPISEEAKPRTPQSKEGLRQALPRPEWPPIVIDYSDDKKKPPKFGAVFDGDLVRKTEGAELRTEIKALAAFLTRERDKGNVIPLAFGAVTADEGERVGSAIWKRVNAAASSRGKPGLEFPATAFSNDELAPNELEVRLNLFALPGEHGFRFFPSFYRHVFDTLKRIPLSRDVDGSDYRSGTVFDNLVPTEEFGYVSRAASRSVLVPRHPIKSVDEARGLINGILEEAGYSPSDLTVLGAGFLKYLTSSRLRREREYENVSWYEFIEGDRLTTRAQYLQETTPGTLLALSGSSADARSQGTIALQLMKDSFAESNKPSADMLLNAPTDLAWFAHWHRYLEDQCEVGFERGELLELGSDGRPRVVIEEDGQRKEVDFVPANDVVAGKPRYVIALPLREASAIAKKLLAEMEKKRISASEARDFADLVSFVGDTDLVEDLKKPTPDGPLRHLSGVQYFFDQDIRLWRGHTQYLDAPYGLSAISQPQFWRIPENLASGYRTVLSVDIGIWSEPKTPDGYGDEVEYAWNRPPDFLAKQIWQQIETQHAGDFPDAWPKLPVPYVYHVDDNLVPDAAGNIAHNRSPFLVNQSGRYRARPGWTGEFDAEDRAILAYHVAFDRYVMAGTHMQTATRITSMEAACESGRRAANALLELLDIAGEPCGVWDPEDFEPEALSQLKKIDRDLCERNCPHALDILRP